MLSMLGGVGLLLVGSFGEVALVGPELIYEAMEKVWLIRERLKTSGCQQKSYRDVRRRDLEFNVEDRVYSKISPMKDMIRFRKKVKLSQII